MTRLVNDVILLLVYKIVRKRFAVESTFHKVASLPGNFLNFAEHISQCHELPLEIKKENNENIQRHKITIFGILLMSIHDHLIYFFEAS